MPEIVNENASTNNYTKYREIEISNKRRFDLALKQSGICNIHDNINAADSFSKFNETFNMLYDQHFPIITKITNHKDVKKHGLMII